VAKADIFQLGVMFFNILSLRHLFDNGSCSKDQDYLEYKSTGDRLKYLASLHKKFPSVNKEALVMVVKCLNPIESLRPTVDDLAADPLFSACPQDFSDSLQAKFI
jgi:serine/threonine protein kinase